MGRLLVILSLMVALAGCGSDRGSSSTSSSAAQGTTTTAATSAPGSANPPGCRAVAAAAPKGAQHLSAPTTRLVAGQSLTVTVTTNCGAFSFRLDVKDSPRTAASFTALVRRGFFDGLSFQRVAANFVIQGGDPLGDGSGGPGYTVVEPPPHGYKYVRGDVAMAKTGSDPAGASGSQFFVVTGDASSLPPDYALLGRVSSGMDVVQTIGQLPTSPPGDGNPTTPVVMTKVTVG